MKKILFLFLAACFFFSCEKETIVIPQQHAGRTVLAFFWADNSLNSSLRNNIQTMMQDAKIMANELMRKAVNYTLNQWRSLRNILKDGAAEISNNLCEQRMKPVKLLLKNCMNIGSEDAAKNSAFIFSLIESCKLNGIDPQDYLKHLFECILYGKDCDKKALLPCFYKLEC